MGQSGGHRQEIYKQINYVVNQELCKNKSVKEDREWGAFKFYIDQGKYSSNLKNMGISKENNKQLKQNTGMFEAHQGDQSG